MFNKHHISLFYITICIINIFSLNATSGLTFQSHEEVKEKRTSLLLNEGKNFYLPNGFCLEFDIKFRTEEHNYGYIYRIIGNDTVCFDLISNYREENKVLSFIEGNRTFVPFKSINEIDGEKWNKVSLKLDLISEKMALSFDTEKIETSFPYKNLSDFRFQFGFCNRDNFVSYDVPPITLRNIRLFDSKNKLIAFWPLEKHNITEVYDSVSYLIAKAYNPVWEIDKHTKWMQEKHLKAPLYTQVAYNKNENCIYFANNENLLIYHIADNSIDTIKVLSGTPFHVSSNQLIYNDYSRQLVSYDLEYTRASEYDFHSKSWSGNEPTLRTPYTHHNSFVSSIDSCIYVFGGYGEYLYKNDLLKFNFKEHRGTKINYDKSISPRYLSAIGFKDHQTLLLLGGYGNESGKQELGPRNYYDLYEINITDFTVKKLWDLNLPNEHYLFSNNMIVDTLRNKIYALTFPNDRGNTYIQLRSYNLDDGKNEILGDTVPYVFEDINSFCSLFLDSNEEKLYAVTIYNNQTESDISIYSLLYPPLSKSEVKQEAPQSIVTVDIITVVFILVVVCCIIYIVIVFLKKQNKKVYDAPALHTNVNAKNEDYNNLKYPKKISSILFLNGFQVWDRQGNDITKDFTPTLRYLLILIVLYTQRNEKGVSNTTLRETLWYDKSGDKAQNNRRVNIQKLKKTLDKLDGVEIVNTNTYWTLKYEEPFFSDYFMVFKLINEIELEFAPKPDKLNDLLHLLLYGTPLPYLHQHWADSFISDYSLFVQEFLWRLIQKKSVKDDDKLQVYIADIIFLFDPTDEDTLILKCSALNRMGKTGQIKTAYDSFCIEYERILGIPFNKDFNTFLKK